MSLEAVLVRPGNVRDLVQIDNPPFRPWQDFDEQVVRDSIRFGPVFESVLLLPSYQSSASALTEANNLIGMLKKFGNGDTYATQLMYLSNIKSYTGELNLEIYKWSRTKFDKAIKWQLDFIEDREGHALISPFSVLDQHIRELVKYKAMVPDLDIKSTLHYCISKIENFDDEIRKKLDYEHRLTPEDNVDNGKFFVLLNNLSFLAYLFIADQDVVSRSEILNSKIYNSVLELLKAVPISSNPKTVGNVLRLIAHMKIFNAEAFEFGPKGLKLVMEPTGPAVQELPEMRRFA